MIINVPYNTTAVDVALSLSGSLAGFPRLLDQLPAGRTIGFTEMPEIWEDVPSDKVGQTWTPDLENKTFDVTLPVYKQAAVEKQPYSTGIKELQPAIEWGNNFLQNN